MHVFSLCNTGARSSKLRPKQRSLHNHRRDWLHAYLPWASYTSIYMCMFTKYLYIYGFFLPCFFSSLGTWASELRQKQCAVHKNCGNGMHIYPWHTIQVFMYSCMYVCTHVFMYVCMCTPYFYVYCGGQGHVRLFIHTIIMNAINTYPECTEVLYSKKFAIIGR